MASPQPNSHFASLRRAVQARPNSFPSSARAVCVLLAALCLVFFFVETSETQKTVQTTTPTVSSSSPSRVASTGGAPAETEEQAKSDTAAAEETLSPVSRGGLRRFSSFKEYVVGSNIALGAMHVLVFDILFHHPARQNLEYLLDSLDLDVRVVGMPGSVHEEWVRSAGGVSVARGGVLPQGEARHFGRVLFSYDRLPLHQLPRIHHCSLLYLYERLKKSPKITDEILPKYRGSLF